MGKIAGNCGPALRGGAGFWVLRPQGETLDRRSRRYANPRAIKRVLPAHAYRQVGLYRAEGAGLDADGHLRHDEVDLVQSNVPRYEARIQRPWGQPVRCRPDQWRRWNGPSPVNYNWKRLKRLGRQRVWPEIEVEQEGLARRRCGARPASGRNSQSGGTQPHRIGDDFLPAIRRTP